MGDSQKGEHNLFDLWSKMVKFWTSKRSLQMEDTTRKMWYCPIRKWCFLNAESDREALNLRNFSFWNLLVSWVFLKNNNKIWKIRKKWKTCVFLVSNRPILGERSYFAKMRKMLFAPDIWRFGDEKTWKIEENPNVWARLWMVKTCFEQFVTFL